MAGKKKKPKQAKPPRELTAKQQQFVHEYLIDLNATQAAIRAGYSDKYANRIASQLLDKTRFPRVAIAVESELAKRSERTQVTQDYVLRKLVAEAELYGDGGSHTGRIRALELLGKHLGMFVDKVAPTDPTGTKEYQGDRNISDDERLRRLGVVLDAARARRR